MHHRRLLLLCSTTTTTTTTAVPSAFRFATPLRHRGRGGPLPLPVPSSSSSSASALHISGDAGVKNRGLATAAGRLCAHRIHGHRHRRRRVCGSGGAPRVVEAGRGASAPASAPASASASASASPSGTTTKALGMMDPSSPSSSRPATATADTVVHHDSHYLLDDDDSDSDGNRTGIHRRRSPMALVVLNMPIGRLGGMHDDVDDVDRGDGEGDGGGAVRPLFDRLWDAASHRVCADGGANRLHDYAHASASATRAAASPSAAAAAAALASLPTFVPDVITGDLDSLRGDVRAHYEKLGCEIRRDPDQDTNDFDKALRAVERHQRECFHDQEGRGDGDGVVVGDGSGTGSGTGGDGAAGGTGGDGGGGRWTVCVYGAFGGRFDQTMASVHALYKWRGKFGQLVLYTDETSARLLEPSRMSGGGGEGGAAPGGGAATTTVTNVIRVPRARARALIAGGGGGGGGGGGTSIPVEGPSCGLLPIGGRCDGVWTTGLRWDLDGGALEFGGLVSTSNEVVGRGGADGGGGGDPVGGIEGGGGGGGGGGDAGVDADAWVVTVRSSHPLVWTTEIR